MKKTLLLAVVVGVGAGIAGRMALRSDAGPATAEQRASSLPTEQIAANGLVEGAQPEVRLWPEAPGVLMTVNVKDNDEVTKGQVLAELSNQGQKAQVKLAASELALAREQLRKLVNGERQQVLTEAEADVKAKTIALNNALGEYERARMGGGGVSGSELDGARSRMDQAKADLEKARARRALLREGTRAEDLEIARRQVDSAQAKLELAEADLAKTRLIAPSDGKVLRVYGQPGALVSATNKDPVMILADLSKRRVRASVEELDVSRVETGLPATITADGLPGKVLTGKVAVVLSRMGKGGPESDAPSELKDMYFREVLIDLDGGMDLPTNLRVQVRIQTRTQEGQ
jgi:multidrug resistance efflux pump